MADTFSIVLEVEDFQTDNDKISGGMVRSAKLYCEKRLTNDDRYALTCITLGLLADYLSNLSIELAAEELKESECACDKCRANCLKEIRESGVALSTLASKMKKIFTVVEKIKD